MDTQITAVNHALFAMAMADFNSHLEAIGRWKNSLKNTWNLSIKGVTRRIGMIEMAIFVIIIAGVFALYHYLDTRANDD
jgi:hypothetical protein